jgi:signal recognition particle receptor subunit alpha
LAFRRSSHNLSYVDKLTDDVHRPFQDKYLTEIQQQSALSLLTGTCDFQNGFLRLLREAEESSKICAPTTMKKFEDSEKAKKPVRSMIETQGGKTKEKAKKQQQQRRWGGGGKKEGSDGTLAPTKHPLQKSQASQGDLRMENFPKRS